MMGNREHESARPFNPYDPPRAALDRARPPAPLHAAGKAAIAVTHDLSDSELKRFVNFDVYHDPMPLFGLVPQWVVVATLTAAAGAFTGAVLSSNAAGAVAGGMLAPVLILGSLDLTALLRRRHARELGLCDGRTVTISPQGLSVVIPGARGTTMRGIGETELAWADVREISAADDQITFWMHPTPADLEGRLRLVVPRRAFASAADADAFEHAARAWHAGATGGGGWWEAAAD